MNELQVINTIKTLPHSIEAEQMVIASILLDEKSLENIEDTLLAEHFYRKEHDIIFKHIVTLRKNKRNIDAITVAISLEQSNELEYVGGHEYLNNLVEAIPSASNIKSYAVAVRERYVLRELIELSTRISETAYNPQGRDIDVILNEFEQKLLNISERFNNNRGFEIQYAPEVIDNIARMQQDKPEMISTNNEKFNSMINGGFRRGNLVTLAGKSGMGKTSIAIHMFKELLSKNKCLFFSMEMDRDEIEEKLYSSLAGTTLQSPHTEDNWDKYASGLSIIGKNIGLLDNPRITLQTIKSYIHQYKHKNGSLDVIFIDYLQLISRDAKLTEYQALSHLTRELKILAKEEDIVIISLSQVNRGNSDRKEKRCLLGDLRGSGSIEQDSDMVIFVHREEYYYLELGHVVPPEVAGILEFTIAKYRKFKASKILYRADLELNIMEIASLTDKSTYSRFLNSKV